MTAVALVAVSFLGMEAVSYAAHRWVMHGPAMGWHRSHHAPRAGRFERNDLFPLCFSLVGVALFAFARAVPALWWVGTGVTAYGAAYLFVHEVSIHRRVGLPGGDGRYVGWLRRAHRDHHLASGEPYGMLLPLRRGRVPDGSAGRDPLDRSARAASSR